MVAQAIPATLLTTSSAALQAIQFQREAGGNPGSSFILFTGVTSAGVDVLSLLIGVFLVARSRQLSAWLDGPGDSENTPFAERELPACPSRHAV